MNNQKIYKLIRKSSQKPEDIITPSLSANNISQPNSKIENMLFTELLSYSPYEKGGGYEMHIKEFIEEIQVSTHIQQKIAKDLIEKLIEETDNNCISFITGFPGVGKTTFINWLIYFIKHNSLNENNPMKPKVLDEEVNSFNLIANYINFSFKSSSDLDGLTTVFSDEVSKNFKNYVKTIDYICNNENVIELDRLDRDFFYKLYKEHKDSPNRVKIKTAIDKRKIPKESLILFLLLQKWIEVKDNESDSLNLFFIDNVDALGPVYLYNKVDNFWEDLYSAYHKFRIIVNRDKDANKFKLIFSLRNYNYLLVAECFAGQSYTHTSGYIFEDEYKLISTELNEILKKRKKYAEAKNLKTNQDLLSIVDGILEEDDLFREKVYLPLFNYDLRSLASHISRITQYKKLGFKFSESKKTYDLLFKNSKRIYRQGARGIVIHSLIKALFKSIEKYPIEPLAYKENSNENIPPYCSECRMLITVIYNLSYEKNKLKNDLSDIDQNHPVFFTLAELIKNLRIFPNSTKQIIPTKRVLDWLEKFNGTNSESHIHLIDISGIKINFKKNNSTGTYEKQVIYGTMLENDLVKEINETSDDELNEKFSKIKIKINPSAVIYLRYLIPHFEFFAAYKYWKNEDFSKVYKPLYLATELKKEGRNYEYEFQSLLKDVFSLVKRKKIQNDLFLTKQLFPLTNIKSIKEYVRSNFSFKLLFDKNKDFPNKEEDWVERSSLYSSRIITKHLEYIKGFKSYLNTDEMLQKITENTNEFNSISITEINNFILDIENQYISLYLENNTPSKKSLLDVRILKLMNNYKNEIENKVKSSVDNINELPVFSEDEPSLAIDESGEIHSTQ